MGRWCWASLAWFVGGALVLSSSACSSRSTYESDKNAGGTAGLDAGAGGATGGANAGGANAGGANPSGASAGGGPGDAGAGSGGEGGDGTITTGKSGFPSCETISDTACSGDDCCASLLVTGCTDCAFPYGYTSTVSDFRLDKYEVTVGRFRSFVNAYEGPPAMDAGARSAIPGSGWQSDWNDDIGIDSVDLVNDLLLRPCAELTIRTYTEDPGGNEAKPMNCMTWYEAFAFCVWDGGFLPTEIQWQYAAAGGAENREYPWPESAVDTDRALYGYCGEGVSSACAVENILEVGSKPLGVGKFGHLDLAGSMWEWVLDYFGAPYPAQPCSDCANLDGTTPRVIRGGGWPEPVTLQNTSERGNDPPESSWMNVGLRCARVAP